MTYDDQFKSDKTLTLVLYLLYIAAIFSAGILAVVALVINYLKKDAMRGSIFESHFNWQIRTVWWYLLWNILGIVPFFFLFLTNDNANLFAGIASLAFFFWLAVVFVSWVWIIYRAIKGLLALNDNRPVA
ncbi:hypothetical protein [Acinetobacter sp. MD2]|uniref:DUF4870 family protein n=1 Tax=Acinetobacter sp. MD2 TaxID=2600066 RepID=UPI002D1F94E7|nr:hypothetical protein [Acinetobacter sp. MD2]MEB3768143.1 hypothetical protein [Acinetobacter sp. MD2]